MKEIETQSIVIKYQTDDGRMFDKKEAAQLHEDLQSGKARVCPNCFGDKVLDPYGDCREFTTCPYCNGKGHQYKIVEWR